MRVAAKGHTGCHGLVGIYTPPRDRGSALFLFLFLRSVWSGCGQGAGLAAVGDRGGGSLGLRESRASAGLSVGQGAGSTQPSTVRETDMNECRASGCERASLQKRVYPTSLFLATNIRFSRPLPTPHPLGKPRARFRASCHNASRRTQQVRRRQRRRKEARDLALHVRG